MVAKYILVMNCGSTSIKAELLSAQQMNSVFSVHMKNVKDFHKSIEKLVRQLERKKITNKDILAIGHRVVHGGNLFSKPLIINKNSLKKLTTLNALAPLHNPHNVDGIKACIKHFHGIKNIAVFDTEFFQNLPILSQLYGIPFDLYKENGIKKYGFHGISNEYILEKMKEKLCKKKPSIIVCHLGGGSSITLIKNGQAFDTSMGFTPNEGVMMAVRSGDINTDIISFLMKEKKWSYQKIQTMLNHESGLKGVSGKSADMLTILKLSKEKNKRALLALDLFCYKVAKYISTFSGLCETLDGIVFTAGIGENSFVVRNKIMSYIPRLSKEKIFIIPTNEAQMIVKKLVQML